MTTLVQAVGDGAVITKRNLLKIKRVPELLVFATLSPIMFVLLFAFILGSAIPLLTAEVCAHDGVKFVQRNCG